MINICNVLNLFSELVRQKYPEPTPDDISSKGHELADQLLLLFDQLLNSTELLIDNMVTLDFDGYNDDNEEYQEEITDSNQANFGGIKYSYTTMSDIVQYSKTHSFPSFRNRYKRIKFKQQLHRIKRYVDVEGTKNQKLERIDEFVFQQFTHARQFYLPVHDFDLRRLAIKKARSLNMAGFTISHHWLLHFKRYHHISSRKVTKLITKNHLEDREKLLKTAESFVKLVNSMIPNYPIDHILNSGQSSFK